MSEMLEGRSWRKKFRVLWAKRDIEKRIWKEGSTGSEGLLMCINVYFLLNCQLRRPMSELYCTNTIVYANHDFNTYMDDGAVSLTTATD